MLKEDTQEGGSVCVSVFMYVCVCARPRERPALLLINPRVRLKWGQADIDGEPVRPAETSARSKDQQGKDVIGVLLVLQRRSGQFFKKCLESDSDLLHALGVVTERLSF